MVGPIKTNLACCFHFCYQDAERYFVMAESLAVQQSQQTADHSPVGEKSEIESLEIFHTEIGGTFSSSIDGITFNMTCISKSPLIYMVPSLLNDEECEHIQQRAKDGRYSNNCANLIIVEFHTLQLK